MGRAVFESLLLSGHWSDSPHNYFLCHSMKRIYTKTYIRVPDRRRRNPEVVLVRRWVSWVLGIRRGKGGCLGKGWERGGQFTSNLRPGWTDPVTARRAPSK